MPRQAPQQPLSEAKKVNGNIDLAGVRALIEPLVAAHELSLFDVEWVTSPAGQILRVSIERPDAEIVEATAATEVAGVTLEQCVAVSRDVSTALDAMELIAPKYNLEVSSPGLDRPLKTARDFVRQRGRLAKLRLKEAAPDGQTVLRGTLQDVRSDGESHSIDIVVDGNLHQVSLDNIQIAKLVFELGGQQKKGRRGSPKGASGRTRKRGSTKSRNNEHGERAPDAQKRGGTGS